MGENANYIRGMEVVVPCEPDVTKSYKLVMKYTSDCAWIWDVVEDDSVALLAQIADLEERVAELEDAG